MTKGILETNIERPSDFIKLFEGNVVHEPEQLRDIVAYSINMGLRVEGKDPREYALEQTINRYLSSSDSSEKAALEKQYQAIHEIGVDQPPLLSMDSDLGRFLSDTKSPQIIANHKHSNTKESFENIDFTRYDLKVIEKAVKVYEESQEKMPQSYDGFSNLQKVAMAFSVLLGPAGPVMAYYAIKHYNNREKENIEKVIEASPKAKEEMEKNITKLGAHSVKDTLSSEIKPKWIDKITQESRAGRGSVGRE